MSSKTVEYSVQTTTRKVFWENPYLVELETRVTGVAANEVTLESTIFYALSGGQESDSGVIGQHSVLQARKEDHQIFYQLPEDHGLNVGDTVKVSIDWARRYKLMRLHFSAEIVLEIVMAKFPAIQKIGAHIAEDKARIDFFWSENLSPVLAEITAEAMRVVHSDIRIVSDYSDKDLERRYWEIPGFARVPCGGTHLRQTSEIGEISLKRDNVGKGKERIVIRVDERTPPEPS